MYKLLSSCTWGCFVISWTLGCSHVYWLFTNFPLILGEAKSKDYMLTILKPAAIYSIVR